MAAVTCAAILGAACGGSSGPVSQPTGVSSGGLSSGLIAYVTDKAVGVLDPASGKTTVVAPLPAGGAFRVANPVWGPESGLPYPVIYFTVHDDRPAESRESSGVVPYDWLFRLDPFAGTIEPIAASQDSLSEGPLGLVANSHYVALTYGCCAAYEVDALDLTQPLAPPRVLAAPPAQAAFFTEGIAPGSSGLIAVREVSTGAWYWLNADAGVLNPFPLALGQDDGPIAITADGTTAAIALPDKGAAIEPINVALPLAPTPNASPTAQSAPTPSAKPSPSPATSSSPAAGVRHVNSKLPHPDGLAWSPDGTLLAVAVNGQLEIYQGSSPDGTLPKSVYLKSANVSGVAWSAPIAGRTLASVKGSTGPQAMVDALLADTALPAAADTPANRPLTKVFLWQYDSTKSSPIASIADATQTVLSSYPPLAAGVVFHHWAPATTWGLLGGCFRYRVVITGSVAPTASTFGLASNSPCTAAGGLPASTPPRSPSPS